MVGFGPWPALYPDISGVSTRVRSIRSSALAPSTCRVFAQSEPLPARPGVELYIVWARQALIGI